MPITTNQLPEPGPSPTPVPTKHAAGRIKGLAELIADEGNLTGTLNKNDAVLLLNLLAEALDYDGQ